MSYTQRHLVGYAMTDSSNGILMRQTTAYAAVNRLYPVSIRYQGLFVLVADNRAMRVRQGGAVVVSKAPAIGQLRTINAYAIKKNPALGQIRQMVSYAIIIAPLPVVKNKTGTDAFYDLLNNNRKDTSITFSASNLGLGVPYPVSSGDKNSGLRISVIGQYGYSGYNEVYYNRLLIVRLFLNFNMAITVAAKTTLRALIPQINTAYGVTLVPTDVVDRDVPAGATGLRLTAAPTSIMWLPDSYVVLGVDPGPTPTPDVDLSSVVTVVKMTGYSEL